MVSAVNGASRPRCALLVRGWTGGDDDDGGGGGTRGAARARAAPRPSMGTQGWASPDASRSESDHPRTCGERTSGWRCERGETCALMLGWWRRWRCAGTLSLPRARGFPAADETHRRRHRRVPSVLERQSPPWHRDGATMRARRVSRRGEAGWERQWRLRSGRGRGRGRGRGGGGGRGGARGSRRPRPASP